MPTPAGLPQAVVDALLLDGSEKTPLLETLRPFLEAASHERLVLPRCSGCSTSHWYPADRCPRCGGAWSWSDAGGGGTVFSYSEVHHAFHPALAEATPYTVALIVPSGAPNVRLVSVVRGDGPLTIGAPVVVARGPRVGAGRLPVFRRLEPARTDADADVTFEKNSTVTSLSRNLPAGPRGERAPSNRLTPLGYYARGLVPSHGGLP